MIEGIVQDLRHGARMLVKNPGFTLIAIASIAIGVGANAAMFSLADGLVLRPLPVPRADQVVSVSATAPRASETFFLTTNRLSYLDYADLRDRAQSFAGLAGVHRDVRELRSGARSSRAEQARDLPSAATSSTCSNSSPRSVALFVPDEDRVPGRDAVVVLAYDTWAEQFGSDPGVVGRQVRLGGLDFTVVGVAPANFHRYASGSAAGVHHSHRHASKLAGSSPATLLEQRNFRYLEVRGRLKPGVSLEQARQEVAFRRARPRADAIQTRTGIRDAGAEPHSTRGSTSVAQRHQLR